MDHEMPRGFASSAFVQPSMIVSASNRDREEQASRLSCQQNTPAILSMSALACSQTLDSLRFAPTRCPRLPWSLTRFVILPVTKQNRLQHAVSGRTGSRRAAGFLQQHQSK
jgi:hypothetical protein